MFEFVLVQFGIVGAVFVAMAGRRMRVGRLDFWPGRGGVI
jgi:hypothetical protein